MREIIDKDNRIITIDKDGNLSIGHFVVKNRVLLEKICKILVQDRISDSLTLEDGDNFFLRLEEDNFNISKKRTWCSNESLVPKIEVIGNKLIRRNNFVEDHLKTYYDEYVYEYLYANTFMILSSLLGNFDKDNCGSIFKNFISYGIIKNMSFADTWRTCSKNLLSSKDNSKDLELFREILFSGIFFDYEVTEFINYDDFKNIHVLKKLDVMLSEIAYNSDVLGTYKKGIHLFR